MNIAMGVLFIYVIVLAHNSSNLTGDIPQLKMSLTTSSVNIFIDFTLNDNPS